MDPQRMARNLRVANDLYNYGIVPAGHIYNYYAKRWRGNITATQRGGNLTRTRRRGRVAKGYTRRVGAYRRFSGNRDKEQKFHDIDIDATFLTTGVFAQVNLIAQGVGESQRVGRKAFIRAIHWRGTLTLPATTTLTSTAVTLRMILFVDKQCNGVAATAVQLLQSNAYNSWRDLINSGRFTILMDRYWTLNCGSGGGDSTTDFGATERQFKFHKKCNIAIQFNGATGAITEIPTNNISVMIIANNAFSASVVSKLRLRFTD